MRSTQVQFEASFVHPHTGAKYTFSFRLGEPVLYHPSPLAKPVFSRIESIRNDHFTVAFSTTDRMIPFTDSKPLTSPSALNPHPPSFSHKTHITCHVSHITRALPRNNASWENALPTE